MCELLGMSANVPTDMCFSFTGLTRRGGGTGPHKDGWGVAFYEGVGVKTFHESLASADSRIAEIVKSHPMKTEVGICHIRQANVGDVCLANTHPFIRELWGRYWTFAHNGQLQGFQPAAGVYEPVGSTDSESIFCDLLNRLRGSQPRDLSESALVDFLVSNSHTYAQQGVFNLLLSNGDWLFTFCTTKMACITRRAPFGPARLRDEEMVVDFGTETTPNDVVSVIVTDPLTADEVWDVYAPGEWRFWRAGEVVQQGQVDVPTHPSPSASQ
ncbi:class II glutamine amidotransferase [Salinispirillum sp. LH 10-3-1]|uniref:Class II glutamine amidotransferase n=1 Tax=Salinispirillum sp. LH 10-3-1 TaxID=2952525 RepID=A0AB38YI56_9GAMM